MSELTYDPILPAKASAGTDGGFVQTIRLRDGGQELGLARWHVRAGTTDGVVQIIDLIVSPDKGRQGLGGQLFDAVVDQSRKYWQLRKGKLRRVWIVVDQKTQVYARAFLTDRGFHHVSSIEELLHKQTALVYMRSFD